MLGMNNSIPTAAEVRSRLQLLTRRRVIELAQTAGVPFPTLVKIRNGQTVNPGVETVRLIWPELVGTDGAPPVPPAEPAPVEAGHAA